MVYPTRNSSRRKKASRSFTLIELMVALALTLLVLGSAWSIFMQAAQAATFSEGLMQRRASIKNLTNHLSREARSGRMVHATQSQVFEFTFTDGAGVAQRARYEFLPEYEQIVRTDVATGQKRVLVEGVKVFEFSYLDKRGDKVPSGGANVNVNAVKLDFEHENRHELGNFRKKEQTAFMLRAINYNTSS